MARPRQKVLLVDDEPALLEGLTLQLRRNFDVVTAQSGAQGLAAIRRQGPFAVVVSDMRMPAMMGTGFLVRVRDLAPDTVRIVLTGDSSAAIEAINDAEVFRFLKKPCPSETLREAVRAGAQRYREFIEQKTRVQATLKGSIQILTNLLALSNPIAFGRAHRVRQLAMALAPRLGIEQSWSLEIAALLSQVGCISLPPKTVERMYYARDLEPDEQAQVARLPEITAGLLGDIPYLDDVREMLRWQREPFVRSSGSNPDGPTGVQIPIGARILKLALDYDALEAQRIAETERMAKLQARAAEYDPAILDAFTELLSEQNVCGHKAEVGLDELAPRMVLADDIQTRDGRLLLSRGLELTSAALAHLGQFQPREIREPIQVLLPPDRATDD